MFLYINLRIIKTYLPLSEGNRDMCSKYVPNIWGIYVNIFFKMEKSNLLQVLDRMIVHKAYSREFHLKYIHAKKLVSVGTVDGQIKLGHLKLKLCKSDY
jgi:hypothetical protein